MVDLNKNQTNLLLLGILVIGGAYFLTGGKIFGQAAAAPQPIGSESVGAIQCADDGTKFNGGFALC